MMKAKRQLKNSGRKLKGSFLNRKGQSLVEFVCVLVLIVIFLVGLVNTILVAYSWVVLQYAASEGSRFGSIGILDPGFVSREDNIRAHVLQITQGFGLGDVAVQFVDQAGGNTAGSASEFFKMKLVRDVQFMVVPAFFSETVNPHYELTAWTVIRNEPF